MPFTRVESFDGSPFCMCLMNSSWSGTVGTEEMLPTNKSGHSDYILCSFKTEIMTLVVDVITNV